jgi:hypothetical protein
MCETEGKGAGRPVLPKAAGVHRADSELSRQQLQVVDELLHTRRESSPHFSVDPSEMHIYHTARQPAERALAIIALHRSL